MFISYLHLNVNHEDAPAFINPSGDCEYNSSQINAKFSSLYDKAVSDLENFIKVNFLDERYFKPWSSQKGFVSMNVFLGNNRT